jgi:hypothetical protein
MSDVTSSIEPSTSNPRGRKGDSGKVSLRLLVQVVAVLGALGLVLFATASDTNGQAKFEPEFTFELTSTEPDATPDSIVDLNVPIGNVNFAGVVAYIPGDWGIVTGDTIPIGAQVGFLSSKAVLGLIGSACNQLLEPEFEMLNGSIDLEDTVSFEDVDDNGTRDYADYDTERLGEDTEIRKAITRYPEFINRLFDDNPEAPLQPIRRSVAITPVAGIPVLLQFLVFPPGTLIDEDIPSDVELGFPSVTLLQNAGDPDVNPEPGAITDFCTPLTSHNETFGLSHDNDTTPDVDESGYKVQINPSAGTYNFTGVAFGQRDADGDTFENSLDTCPYEQNDGDARVNNSGDLDGDGLDSVCDPNDDPATGGTNSDQDGDGYLNRQDNCPLISNGQDTTNQNDNDRDAIGDVCDTTPGEVDGDDTTADGELIPFRITAEQVIGGGTGAGGPPSEAGCTGPSVLADGADANVCWNEEWEAGTGGGDSSDETPPPTDDEGNGTTDGDDDGGSNTAAIIGVVAAVAAIVAVVGAGIYFIRRRGETPPSA